MSYKKALNPKNILQELSLGNFERSYKFLSTYGKELLRAIPGIVFKVVVNEDLYPMRGAHYSLFWGFKPYIISFQTRLQPILTVDVTFLKGKFEGCLLIACVFDGDNGQFLLHML